MSPSYRSISHILVSCSSDCLQTCQVSRNFRESPEIEHDLQVSRKCYKISRNLGSFINLIFSAKKHAFCVNPRGFWCESEKCWSQGTEQRLRRDYVCINSVFGIPGDGATCEIGSVQWRHHVMMRVTTMVDQDSRHFTCSTWQLCVWHGVCSSRTLGLQGDIQPNK